jgi:competence protein ComEC
MPFWDRKIELMVLTHPQTDHMNGLIEVLRRYRVERVFVNGETSLTADFSAFQKALNEEKTQVFIGNRGDLVRYGELVVKIIWPLEELGKLDDYVSVNTSDSNININEKDVNEGSIVVLVTYNQFDVLFTGDIGIDTERLIISDGIIGEVEVLKVAHHGSKYSSSEGFLTLVSPEIAVISAGKKNRFGHPTKETLERLDQAGARALRTDVLGDVVVETDGEKFRIKN